MDFDTWYVENFGKRPSKLSLHELHSIALESRYDHERDQDLWDKTYQWEVNKEAAKRAWDVKK